MAKIFKCIRDGKLYKVKIDKQETAIRHLDGKYAGWIYTKHFEEIFCNIPTRIQTKLERIYG